MTREREQKIHDELSEVSMEITRALKHLLDVMLIMKQDIENPPVVLQLNTADTNTEPTGEQRGADD